MKNRAFFFAIFTSSLLSGFTSHAEERVAEKLWMNPTSSAGETQFWVSHWEETGWVVDEFRVSPTSLQIRVGTRTFPDESSADFYLAGLAPQIYSQSVGTARIASAVTEDSTRRIWNVKQAWDAEWEEKYSRWVETAVGPSFAMDHGLSTDCADLAIALRWIFARQNALPAANQLAGSGVLFTQDSFRREWSDLPVADDWTQDKLFLAALDYVLANAYTHTLLRDSYPIRISAESLRPGRHHLVLFNETGHTLIVTRTGARTPQALPLTVAFSTMPRTVRTLMTGGYWNSELPVEGNGGFLGMRWPTQSSNGVWSLVAPAKMSDYSTEQFDPRFLAGDPFWLAIAKRLMPGFDTVKVMENLYKDIDLAARTRVTVVKDGYAICNPDPEKCAPGTALYEEWSTPNRDARLAELFSVAELAATQFQLEADYQRRLRETLVELDGKSYSFGAVRQIWIRGFYDSDPRTEPEIRWALSPQGFSRSARMKIDSPLREREAKIKSFGERCRQDPLCTPGSALWEQAQTSSSERELFVVDDVVSTYCEFQSSDNCEAVTRYVAAEKLSYGGHVHSLADWMSILPWLVFDPRAPISYRWGEHRSKYFYVTRGESSVLQSGFELVQSNGGSPRPLALVNLRTEKRWDLSSSQILSPQVVINVGRAAWAEKLGTPQSKLVVLDAKTGTHSEILEPQLAGDTLIYWQTEEVFQTLSQSEKRIAYFQYFDQKLRKLSVPDQTVLSNTGENGILHLKNNAAALELLDARGATPKRIGFPSTFEGPPIYVRLFPTSSPQIFVAIINRQAGDQVSNEINVLDFENQTSRVALVGKNNTQYTVFDQGRWVLEQSSETRFFEITSTGTAIERAHFKDLQHLSSPPLGPYVSLNSSSGAVKILKAERGRIDFVPLQADEVYMGFWFPMMDDRVVTFLNSGKYRIRSLEGGPALMEAPALVFGNREWITGGIAKDLWSIWDLKVSSAFPVFSGRTYPWPNVSADGSLTMSVTNSTKTILGRKL